MITWKTLSTLLSNVRHLPRETPALVELSFRGNDAPGTSFSSSSTLGKNLFRCHSFVACLLPNVYGNLCGVVYAWPSSWPPGTGGVQLIPIVIPDVKNQELTYFSRRLVWAKAPVYWTLHTRRVAVSSSYSASGWQRPVLLHQAKRKGGQIGIPYWKSWGHLKLPGQELTHSVHSTVKCKVTTRRCRLPSLRTKKEEEKF